MTDGYHHGNLRRALLDEAATMIENAGPADLSLRELARRVGVSHGAPAHHFRDRRGLLTALAAQGLDMLAHEVRTATPHGFEEAAVAYVRFARQHPGHYTVMFAEDLLCCEDSVFVAARVASWEALLAGVETIPTEHRALLTTQEAAQAAWSLVHGLASLTARQHTTTAAEGLTPTGRRTRATEGASADDVVRRIARQLFS